jgi:hypothetical protein
LGALIVEAAAVVIILREDVAPGMLSRDPADFVRLPWYLGALSTLGIVLWTASAAVCGLTSYFLHRSGSRSQAKIFLLVSACVSGLLMIDDAYLLHDRVLPGAGVSDSVTYTVYALVVFAYIAVFMRTWRRTLYLVMFAAFTAFAVSILMDVFWTHPFGEDVFKLAGIVFWFSYVTTASALLFREDSATAAAHRDAAQQSPIVLGAEEVPADNPTAQPEPANPA